MEAGAFGAGADKLFRAFVLLLLLTAVAAADEYDYAAVTSVDAPLRASPSSAREVGTVPAGTTLNVTVCFDEGLSCAVEAPGIAGFVAGDLLVLEADRSTTILSLEKARWEKYRAVADAQAPLWVRQNVVAWGDSLSFQSYDNELQYIFPERSIALNGKSGDDGKMILARMKQAGDAYRNWITVIWDRHYSKQTADDYVRDLRALIDSVPSDRIIVIGDIASTLPDEAAGTERRKMVETVNARLQELYGKNFIDLNPFLDDPRLRKPDGVHLTAAGNQIVAEKLAAFIRENRW